MNKPAPNPYLRTKIMTASPEELRLMLYDGCLKFCRGAKAELVKDKPNFEAVYENFMRAQKIVLELSTSLNHDVAPDLCEKLSALYTYIYRLLVDANLEREPSKIDEAVQLLEYERETWVMFMQRNAEAQPATPGQSAGQVNAQQTAISSLSKSA
ncbi:MAG: flagellar export chaperone FliS [Planctomycetota bacterium]